MTSNWAATPIGARMVIAVGASERILQITVEGSTPRRNIILAASSSGCWVSSQITSVAP